ncbi:MAG: hypothetical protein ACK4GT_20695, partial [Pararhodobacter sp.]
MIKANSPRSEIAAREFPPHKRHDLSPIFNHHALNGLSTSALEQLRSIIRQSLGSDRLSEPERI